MSVKVNKAIQTGEEGFLLNLDDWNENVASADGIDMTENAGLLKPLLADTE